MTFETRYRFPVSHDVTGDAETEQIWAADADDAFKIAVAFCATPFKGHQKPLDSTRIEVSDWDLAQVGRNAYLSRREFDCVCPQQLDSFIAKHIADAKNALQRYRKEGSKWDLMQFQWSNAAKRVLKRKRETARRAA